MDKNFKRAIIFLLLLTSIFTVVSCFGVYLIYDLLSNQLWIN